MENVIKGWFLTLIGFIGVIAIIAHASGFYVFPNPEFFNTKTEVSIGLLICFALVVFKKTKIETYIEEFLKPIIDFIKKKE